MSRLAVVAIIGRPNVGKSSLFNRFIGERISIEEPTEGVTRDRVSRYIKLGNCAFELLDTGGIGIVDRMSLEDDVEEQIQFAISGADIVLFLVDGQNIVTDLDRLVAKKIRLTGMPHLFIANKVDNETISMELDSFQALGFGFPLGISILHNLGIPLLKEKVIEMVETIDRPHTFEEVDGPRVAFVGRRNVGKSSLCNHLCGEKRVIVSEMAGTTRDAIDMNIEWNGLPMTIIDTAGLRKKSQTEDSIEFFSVSRTFGALYRADVVFFLIDAEQGISQVDKKLAMWIRENSKPCILVINKWDLAQGVLKEDFHAYLDDNLSGLSHAPVVMISALRGQGMTNLFRFFKEILRQNEQNPSTSEINKTLEKAVIKKMPKRMGGIQPKLQYAVQVSTNPPTFVIFGRGVQKLDQGYRRYLIRFFRERLDMVYLPVRFVFKDSRKDMTRNRGVSKTAFIDRAAATETEETTELDEG